MKSKSMETSQLYYLAQQIIGFYMRGFLASKALIFILSLLFLFKFNTIVLQQSYEKRSDVTMLTLRRLHTEIIQPYQDIEKKWVKMIMIRGLKSVQIRCFFGSVFSCIWTEYIEILRISPYSVQMWENTYQKNSVFGHFSQSDCIPVVFGLNSENKGVWIELQIVLFMFFLFYFS